MCILEHSSCSKAMDIINFTVLVLSEQCKLYCSVSDLSTTNFYKMNDKVEDGTKCTKDGTDICVGGACLVMTF